MEKATIIVVEDESVVAKDIQSTLIEKGYKVPAVAYSGEDAVKKVQEFKPDIVLMDIVLKGKMDGVEAANQIVSLYDIPVIFITAFADDLTLQRAKKSEPFGYLLKPYEENELQITIEMALYKHQMDKKLRDSEKWLSTTLRSIGDAVIATDENGKIIFMNQIAENLTGWALYKAKGKDLCEVFRIINEFTKTATINPVEKVLKEGIIIGLANHTILISHDGREIPIDDSAAPIINDKGKIIGVVLVFRDITERKKTEEEIRYRNEFEKIIISISTNFINIPTIEIDKGINQALKLIGEFTKADRCYILLMPDDSKEIKKAHIWSKSGIIKKEEFKKMALLNSSFIQNKLIDKLETVTINNIDSLSDDMNEEKKYLKEEGIKSIIAIPMVYGNSFVGILGLDSASSEKIWAEESISLLQILGEIFYNALMRKKVEEDLRYLSLHDPLTKLYNRAFFEEEMRLLEKSRNISVGLIICDVDGLKNYNDTFGHKAGDDLLISASTVIKNCFRETDIVARVGGDEFAVLIANTTEEKVAEACERIRNAIISFNQKESTNKLSISIGYGFSSNKFSNMNDLFKEADNNMYKEKLHRTQSSQNNFIQALRKTQEIRDFYTAEHSYRLEKLVELLAKECNLSEHKIPDLHLLAQFHDIGKVGIPDRLLLKSGVFNSEESEEMKRHCEIGYKVALSIPGLAHIADWILKHHEWWNGKGYPLGLKEEDIPIECRILSITDAYDTMISDRPYRKAMSKEEAISELKKYSGSQFDPYLISKFLKILKEYVNGS